MVFEITQFWVEMEMRSITIDPASWRDKVLAGGYLSSMALVEEVSSLNLTFESAIVLRSMFYDVGAWGAGQRITTMLANHEPAIQNQFWGARFAFELGDFEHARNALLALLNSNIFAAQARAHLVQLALILDQGVSLDAVPTDDPWDLASRIRICLRNGDKEQARNYLSQIGDDFDLAEKKQLEALLAYAQKGAGAVSEIQAALKLRPGNSGLWLLYAKTLTESAPEQALDILENAHGFRTWWRVPVKEAIQVAVKNDLANKAIPWAERLIKCASSPQDYALAADVMRNVRRIPVARAYLEKARSFWPDDLGLIFQQAVTEHDGGALTKAIAGYEAVLEREPKHQGALANLAAAAQMRGDYAKAQQAYSVLNQNNPNNIEWLLALAGLARSKMEISVAEQYYQKVLKLEATNFAAIDGLVGLQLMAGNTANAAAFAKRAYESMPSDLRRALLYVRLLKDQGKRDKARQLLEVSLQITSERFALWCEWVESRLAINPSFLEEDIKKGLDWASPQDGRYHLWAAVKLAALGKFEFAEKCFQLGVERDPANALPLYAEFEIQRGRRDSARELLLRRQELDKKDPSPLLALIRMASRDGNFAEAFDLLAKVEKDFPLHEKCFKEKVSLLWRCERYDEAKKFAEYIRDLIGDPASHDLVVESAERLGDGELYSQVVEQYLAAYPTNDRALKFAAGVQFSSGNSDAGVALLKRRVELNPLALLAKLDVIRAHFALGEYETAKVLAEQVLEDNRDYPAACIPLIQIAIELGDYLTAKSYVDRLVDCLPANSAVLSLGIELASRNTEDPWIDGFYKKILRQIVDPDLRGDFEVAILTRLGKGESALQCAEAWVKQRSTVRSAHQALLTTMMLLEKWDEMLPATEAALLQFPADGFFQILRGQVCEKLKLFSRAEADYLAVLSRDASNVVAKKYLLGLYSQMGFWDSWEKYFYALKFYLGAQFSKELPEFFFSLVYHPGDAGDSIVNYYQQWAKLVEFNRPVYKRKLAINKPNLTIGYVSGDFRKHAMFGLIESLLMHHDKQRYRIVAYATHPAALSDDATEKTKQYVDVYHQADRWSGEEFRKRIEQDDIDMLVDLSQHTSHNRLELFPRRIVPAQIGFQWAHMQSSGLSCFDALIVDPLNCDETGNALVTEHIEFAPGVGTVLTPGVNDLKPADSIPFDRNGFITYLFPMRPHRLNDRLLLCWRKILERVPTARLRLDHPAFTEADYQQKLYERLERLGLPKDRIWLGNVRPYSQVFAEGDIVLDSFPANGATVVRDSLLCGCPVVNLRSRPLMGRAGSGYLAVLGLEDWSASSEEEYIEIAVRKAAAINELRDLRISLREKIFATPACQPSFMAEHVMRAYDRIWARACERDQKQ